MKILKKILIILGSITLLIIVAAGIIFYINPLNIRSLLSSPESITNTVKAISGKLEVEPDGIDKNPLLDETQEAQLEAIGIDPASIPSEITPEMNECFTEKLGSERVAEIIAGDSPSTTDLLKAGSCI